MIMMARKVTWLYTEYSFFEKGCQRKCTQQSWKVLWVGFEFTVFQRNLKQWYERSWMYVCMCKRKATKVGLTTTESGTVYWSYPILPFGIVACTFVSDNLSWSIAVCGQSVKVLWRVTFSDNKQRNLKSNLIFIVFLVLKPTGPSLFI